MARHISNWRFASAKLIVIVATLWGAQAALGQYTWVQDTDGTGNWDDTANWLDGGSNTTFPDAAGAMALFTAPVRTGSGAYNLNLPADNPITVGSITIDNSNFANNFNVNINNGELIFQSDTADPAKYTETLGTAPNGPNRYTINSAIRVLSDLEITQANIPGLNTGTIFSNIINGPETVTITKKGADANLQLNYGFALGPDEGFLGKFVIDEGGIRLINAPPIAKSTGITVNSGGQLQLGQNSTNVIANWDMASGAVLTLNGDGKDAGNNAEGALRFQLNPAASPGVTSSFNNPVTLQTDARIDVQPAPTNVADPPNTGILSNVVSGVGGLIKGGPGVLILSNAANNYTGDTRIQNGTLSITNPFLENSADVYLPGMTSMLDLNFAGTDVVDSFFIDGVAQLVGTWGAMGNTSADHETSRITGAGLLQVTTLPPPALLGDYNGNGTVDAADYVLWRNGGPLLNEVDNPGTVDDQDYVEWRARFGNTSTPGSGGATVPSALPEPGTGLLALLALGGMLAIAAKR